MTAKDYRSLAWGKLSGNWGKPILVFFLIGLIQGLVSFSVSFNTGDFSNPAVLSMFVFLSSLSGLIGMLIAGPMMLSTVHVSLCITDGLDYQTGDVFYGFKNYARSLLLTLINGIFIFLWTLLLIVPGIIKAFSYSMSYYILHDNPEMDANDARIKSMEMMEGHKWEYFCLGFSFIGWILLSCLTLGILFLWIVPYMNVACAEFYNNLKPKPETVEYGSEYEINNDEYIIKDEETNE